MGPINAILVRWLVRWLLYATSWPILQQERNKSCKKQYVELQVSTVYLQIDKGNLVVYDSMLTVSALMYSWLILNNLTSMYKAAEVQFSHQFSHQYRDISYGDHFWSTYSTLSFNLYR